MIKKNKKAKVLVAMSGGVDSAVAAALLKKQGYEVAGVFMRFWKEPGKDGAFENKCCSLEVHADLKKIGKTLGINILTINAEKEFKKEVVDYFLREYKNGRTPNPCIVCNREIKFKLMLKKMLEIKADHVATGHYAQIAKRITRNAKRPKYILLQAKDENKDQSYFLYTLNQKQLAKILFPIGQYKKTDVRKIAKEYKIPVHDKPDSQDVCFISDTVSNFLKRHLKLKKGEIVDENGKILGRHQGLPLYTIGQRKGINIGGQGPFYVYGKELKNNVLRVTNNPKIGALYSRNMTVQKVNWICDGAKIPALVSVKTRYHNPSVSAIIKSCATRRKTCNLRFNKPQKAVTPGQSAVFYSKRGEVLGGGIIN